MNIFSVKKLYCWIFFPVTSHQQYMSMPFSQTLINIEYLTAFTHKQVCLSQENVHGSDDKSSMSVMWNELNSLPG